VRRPGGRRDALDGDVEVVDPFAVPVLDRAARETGVDRAPDGRGDTVRVVGEAVLEVGGDGQRPWCSSRKRSARLVICA
jgi:hypothetical protein